MSRFAILANLNLDRLIRMCGDTRYSDTRNSDTRFSDNRRPEAIGFLSINTCDGRPGKYRVDFRYFGYFIVVIRYLLVFYITTSVSFSVFDNIRYRFRIPTPTQDYSPIPCWNTRICRSAECNTRQDKIHDNRC